MTYNNNSIIYNKIIITVFFFITYIHSHNKYLWFFDRLK